MTHVRKVSRLLPSKALDWPESHTYVYILQHLPTSVLDIVRIALVHVKKWPE